MPVYASDTLAVIRVADSFYIASDYTQGKKGYIAFLVNSRMIRALMLDNGYLQQMAVTLDREALASMMFELDENTFRQFRRKSKDNPLTDLRHNFVDSKMEQWIFDTFGKPEIPVTEPKGIRSLFRRNS